MENAGTKDHEFPRTEIELLKAENADLLKTNTNLIAEMFKMAIKMSDLERGMKALIAMMEAGRKI
jgi:hypothetical protein